MTSKGLRHEVVVIYDSPNVFDGFGAQLHRILSLIHVSNQFNLRMWKPRIDQITLHPLDPIKTVEEMRQYLVSCEQIFFQSALYLTDYPDLISTEKRSAPSLNLTILCKAIFLSFFFRKPYMLTVQEAHSIADLEVHSYWKSIQLYFESFLDTHVSSRKNNELIIHYRQGAGNFAVYPGQSISRQMPVNYFMNMTDKVITNTGLNFARIRVFTDSPKTDLVFFPVREQIHLWEQSPGFDGSKLTHKGLDVEPHFQSIGFKNNIPITVERNLGPAEMIIEMANAAALITSRSSLSYVAGLFNSSGLVVSAPEFWHTKPRQWISGR